MTIKDKIMVFLYCLFKFVWQLRGQSDPELPYLHFHGSLTNSIFCITQGVSLQFSWEDKALKTNHNLYSLQLPLILATLQNISSNLTMS